MAIVISIHAFNVWLFSDNHFLVRVVLLAASNMIIKYLSFLPFWSIYLKYTDLLSRGIS